MVLGHQMTFRHSGLYFQNIKKITGKETSGTSHTPTVSLIAADLRF